MGVVLCRQPGSLVKISSTGKHLLGLELVRLYHCSFLDEPVSRNRITCSSDVGGGRLPQQVLPTPLKSSDVCYLRIKNGI